MQGYFIFFSVTPTSQKNNKIALQESYLEYQFGSYLVVSIIIPTFYQLAPLHWFSVTKEDSSMSINSRSSLMYKYVTYIDSLRICLHPSNIRTFSFRLFESWYKDRMSLEWEKVFFSLCIIYFLFHFSIFLSKKKCTQKRGQNCNA